MERGNRAFYLDALRGFAMLCVVIGHLSLFCYKDAQYSSIAFLVNIFHVNLFMLISGYFVKYENLKIKKHLKILIPFFVFGIPYAYIKGYSPWEFLGNETKVGYWFLWSLSIYYISLGFIKLTKMNLIKGMLLVQVIFLFLHLLLHRTTIGMFIGTDHLWSLWSFFCLGYFLHHGIFDYLHSHRRTVYFIAGLAIATCASVGGAYNLFDSYWPSIILRWILAFPICIFLTLAFYQIELRLKGTNFVGKEWIKQIGSSIGTNTLQVYVLHYYLLLILNLKILGNFMIQNHLAILEYIISPILAIVIAQICIWISDLLHSIHLGILFGR